jgi:sortase A
MALVKALRITERFLLCLGISALAVYVGVRVHGFISSRGALERFRTLEQPRSYLGGSNGQKFSLLQREELDFSLWSEKRIAGYREALTRYFAPPLAVVRIPKIHIMVPLFDGTDEVTLNRGVGRIVGTAKPGQVGNIGVAGHRGGFFRGLKDIGPGDMVELEMPNRTDRYVVDNVQITSPEDVSVLQPSAKPSLTLVTCYPFFFVGSAPQRYIVHASATDLDRFSSNPAYQMQSEVTKINLKEKLK